MKGTLKIICFFFSHNRFISVFSERALSKDRMNPEFGTKGFCKRCGYKWNDLNPNDISGYLIVKRNKKIRIKPRSHL